MAHGTGTLDWILELISPLGTVRTRRMFGGHGLYLDGLFIAILAGDALYLKADAQEQAAFAAAGSQPFRYRRQGSEQAVLSYWRAPDEAMESPEGMAPWARRALASALRAAAPKPAAAQPKARASSPRAAPKPSPSPRRRG